MKKSDKTGGGHPGGENKYDYVKVDDKFSNYKGKNYPYKKNIESVNNPPKFK